MHKKIKYDNKIFHVSHGYKCPECKCDVVIRKNRKTDSYFKGCSNYPECKWGSWETYFSYDDKKDVYVEKIKSAIYDDRPSYNDRPSHPKKYPVCDELPDNPYTPISDGIF